MYKMLKQKGAKQNKPAKKIRKDQCLARTEAFLGCLPERGHFLGKLRTSSEIQRQSLLSWACVQRRGPTQANPFFFASMHLLPWTPSFSLRCGLLPCLPTCGNVPMCHKKKCSIELKARSHARGGTRSSSEPSTGDARRHGTFFSLSD